ncbi:hypothetical protein BCR34DRAFT_606224 [Clohesyomyces aquaticus]|uniref:Uncharacterized protein n=1 Tax=Clohesyomyces aquaticus TaxID=1231657 RepID=A0A1Y1YR79_9PLEO|nr:hypothetical protein BCR34DRAFT_606224 [Clohesyomyces aquaticus]
MNPSQTRAMVIGVPLSLAFLAFSVVVLYLMRKRKQILKELELQAERNRNASFRRSITTLDYYTPDEDFHSLQSSPNDTVRPAPVEPGAEDTSRSRTRDDLEIRPNATDSNVSKV